MIPLADFTPEPVIADNWRDHTNHDGPSCTDCGHPLWAPQSVAGLLCAGCAEDVHPGYTGPPYLTQQTGNPGVVTGGPRVPCRNGE